MIKILVFLFQLILLAFGEGEDIRIFCPLKWVPFNNGFTSESIPGNAIASKQGKYYVARVYNNNSQPFIGYLDIEDMSAHAAVAESPGRFSSDGFVSYEILLDVYGCDKQWVDKHDRDIGKFGLHNDMKIARSDAEMMSGHLQTNNFQTNNLYLGTEPMQSTNNFKVLISYRPGVTLKITNFNLEIEPDSENGEVDFIGLDTITNNADVTIIQTVTHTKLISESVSMTESSFSETSVSVSHSFGVHLEQIGYGANIAVTKTEGEGSGTSETVSQKNERIVVVSREVVLPPFRSVTVCSTISNNDKYNSSYTAKAEFSSPGLSAQAIKEHLVALKVDGPFSLEGLVVSKQINGYIAATLAMETQFIVVPQDSIVGCEGLKQESIRKKNARIAEKAAKIMAQVAARKKELNLV